MAVAPYPSLEAIVEAARIKLNDAIIPGGEVLTDAASFTIDYINLAYQKFQQLLVSLGYETLEDEVVLSALAVVASTDPGVFVSLSWTGYNDGTTAYPAVVLPQSLIRPVKLWERSTVAVGVFFPMDEILNGMDAVPKQGYNAQWEWRADAIYMPGANVTTDLRIRFAKYLPDFVANSTTAFSAQPVPIMRCEDAFSGFVAYEMAGSRGDVDGASLLADAKEATMIIVGLDSSVERGTQKTSERGKMRDRYTPGGVGGVA